MTRLATSIGSFPLVNPVICGAGEPVMTEAGIRAALSAGAAGVIAKSVNENPAGGRQLDRADYVRLDADGVPTAGQGVSLFNRSGLMQRDTADWFAAIAALDRMARDDGKFVAASIVYAEPAGAVSIAAMGRAAGSRVFELNVGAPHASEAAAGAIVQETDPDRLADLVRQVRAATQGMQLWVKLTGLSSNLPALAIAARRGGADAVCMMGRFMGLVPDLETFAPVLGTSAAYGGGWALPIVCRFLALTRRATQATLPLIGTNGVRSGGDVLRMALCGAAATELLSVVMHEGFGGLTRVIQELDSFLARRGLIPTAGEADSCGLSGGWYGAPGWPAAARGKRLLYPAPLTQPYGSTSRAPGMMFHDLIGRSADALTGYGEQAENPLIPTAGEADSCGLSGGGYCAPGWPAAAREKRLIPTAVDPFFMGQRQRRLV